MASKLRLVEREIDATEDLLKVCPPLPPPPLRTKWTRRVPHPVLIGHAASLTRTCSRHAPPCHHHPLPRY